MYSFSCLNEFLLSDLKYVNDFLEFFRICSEWRIDSWLWMDSFNIDSLLYQVCHCCDIFWDTSFHSYSSELRPESEAIFGLKKSFVAIS